VLTGRVWAHCEGNQGQPARVPGDGSDERRAFNADTHRLARSTLSRSFGRYLWFMSPPNGVCNSYAFE
jgi:hypothetical protein